MERSCRLNIYFFSEGITGVVAPLFLAFFAARFSFKVMAGFFIASLLLFRSFDMVILRTGMSGMSISYRFATVLQASG